MGQRRQKRDGLCRSLCEHTRPHFRHRPEDQIRYKMYVKKIPTGNQQKLKNILFCSDGGKYHTSDCDDKRHRGRHRCHARLQRFAESIIQVSIGVFEA